MKFVIFGLTLSSSWGNGHATPYRALLRALARAGHSITFYEKDVSYYAARRDFSACDYCRLVLYPHWEAVRAVALREAAEADVVICASYCPTGARICDEVLALARPLRVFYDLDTPITLANFAEHAADSGEGSATDYLRAGQIPGFDLYLSFTGGGILQELEQRWGARCARPLYGCVDPEVHARVEPRGDFRCHLSYMGTYAADRQEKLDQLFLEPARREPRADFLLAGSLYPYGWAWPANVRRFEHIAPGEHAALYSSSRLTLNLTRAEMARRGWCPSGRFFEAAACGTPLVSDWSDGLDDFFRPGEEIIVARRAEDVLATLSLGDGELALLAARARGRTLAEHTGEVRARQLVEWCEAARGASESARAA